MRVRIKHRLQLFEAQSDAFQPGSTTEPIPIHPPEIQEDLKLHKRPSNPNGPKERLNPVERARINPRSLKSAIKAKCYVCCGGGQDEGVRVRIRECTVVICPLHSHRPYRPKD